MASSKTASWRGVGGGERSGGAGPGRTRAAVQRRRTARLASVVTAGLQGAPSAPPWSRAAPSHQRAGSPPQHPMAGLGSSVSRRWSLKSPGLQAGRGARQWGRTLGSGAPWGLCCPAARIASRPRSRAKTRGGDWDATSHLLEGRMLAGEMKRAFAFHCGECQEYTKVERSACQTPEAHQPASAILLSHSSPSPTTASAQPWFRSRSRVYHFIYEKKTKVSRLTWIFSLCLSIKVENIIAKYKKIGGREVCCSCPTAFYLLSFSLYFYTLLYATRVYICLYVHTLQ